MSAVGTPPGRTSAPQGRGHLGVTQGRGRASSEGRTVLVAHPSPDLYGSDRHCLLYTSDAADEL